VVLLNEIEICRQFRLAALAILFISFAIMPARGGKDQITVPLLTKPVTLDGMWTSPDEWKDAAEIAAPGGFFGLKHDQSYLYVLCDYVNDSALEEHDASWVYVDTLNNGGSTPQADDFAFSLQWLSPTQSTVVEQRGTGSDWMTTTFMLQSAVSSMDATNDPYSASPHVIYEFRIQLSILTQATFSFGASLVMQDGSTAVRVSWPQISSRSDPNQWGILQLRAIPISEFSVIPPTLVFSMLIPLFLRRRPRRRGRVSRQPESR
jgi:hypothetical protein